MNVKVDMLQSFINFLLKGLLLLILQVVLLKVKLTEELRKPIIRDKDNTFKDNI